MMDWIAVVSSVLGIVLMTVQVVKGIVEIVHIVKKNSQTAVLPVSK